MKKGELSLIVLADYSKTFDTVSYSVVLLSSRGCINIIGFLKVFFVLDDKMPLWSLSVHLYIQIDDKK